MDEVMKLDKDIYLYHGKVVEAVDPGLFEHEGYLELREFVDVTLASPENTGNYGVCTSFGIAANDDDRFDVKYMMIWQRPFDTLPDNIRDILRKEFPDHADEI